MDGARSELRGKLDDKNTLQEVEYANNIGRKGKVVYRRVGNRIIFSGVEVPDNLSNTVNQAESVLRAIAEAEELDCHDPKFGEMYEFYDLSTPKGFPSRQDPREKLLRRAVQGVGDIELDRLHVVHLPGGIGFYVKRWEPVNMPQRAGDLFALLPESKK